MKTQTKALVGASAIVVVALMFAYPVFAASLTAASGGAVTATPQSTSTSPPASAAQQGRPAPSLTAPLPAGALHLGLNSQPGKQGHGPTSMPPSTESQLTVGQTVTLTSTSGTWRVINPSTMPAVSTGTASGTLTLAVSGSFQSGYALSISAGSLTINGTTYTIASGSAELGPYQAQLVGQGTFTSASPGSFLVSGQAHASFFNNNDTLRFDVEANGVEYGVVLQVSGTSSS